jgi:preprotein translocase subunit SecF
MLINFIKLRKIFFIFSGILIVGGIILLFVFGLKLGQDFTGGSILEIEYKGERPSNPEIKNSLSELNLGDFSIQPTAEKGIILKMKNLSEEEHQKLLEKLSTSGEIEEKRFESVGPTIGKELKEKTKVVIIVSILAIVFYIIIAFSKVSKIIRSWQYGATSFFILLHDVLIPLIIFAILGKFYNVQLTIPVVTALLTVVGYAINNVVVVYDRLRENLLIEKNPNLEECGNKAINQTLSRQINTSLTTLFPLLAILFFGGETLKYFSLALISGILSGTYSSIFLAIPILISWQKLMKRKY